MRNVPATPGRLVKLDDAFEESKAGLTSGQEAKHESQSGQSADESATDPGNMSTEELSEAPHTDQ